MKKWPAAVSHIYSKIIIAVGFGIFYFENLGSLGTFFKALVGANGNKLTDAVTNNLFMNNIFLFAAAIILCCPVIPKIKELAAKRAGAYYAVRTAGMACNIAVLAVSSLLLLNNTNNPFLYFRF